MPEVYIQAASQRLLEAGQAYLSKNDYVRYTYQVNISPVYMARNPIDLIEGDYLMFADTDLGISGSIIIDTLRIKDDGVPTYEVTLTEEKQVGTLQKLQNQINYLLSGSGGSVDLKQTESLIKLIGSKQFLSRINPDTAQGLITFLRGLTSEQIAILEKGWKTKEFVPGLVGTGANFDEFGYGEMRGLRLWEFLEVPELRFNRVNIYTGIRWDTFGGGIIESVEIDTDELGNELQSGIITLKLEDGEYGAIATDDLCQGIFHNFGGSNDTINEDQRNGNFRFKGFNTSYFRITEVLDGSNKTFRYVLRGLSERWTQQHHLSHRCILPVMRTQLIQIDRLALTPQLSIA